MGDYWILSCPDGAECLSLLERIYIITKDPDWHVDDGLAPCGVCLGSGWVEEDYHRNRRCPSCRGAKKSTVQLREPSSHKLVRAIIRKELPGYELLRHIHITAAFGSTVQTADLREWRARLIVGSPLLEDFQKRIPIVFDEMEAK